MTSSFDNIYKKMASSGDAHPAHAHEHATLFDPAKHVAPVIAHELNNILTIVQGYADRLIAKYPDDATLKPQLKLITEAARRAAVIIRDATPHELAPALRHTPASEPESAAA
jgi:hypothetical protein